MLTLTTPIAVPNVTRIQVLAVDFDEDAEVAFVTIEARSPPATGLQYAKVRLRVANAPAMSHRLARNAEPTDYTNALVLVSQAPIANGYTALAAAWFGAANKAARRSAAETQGLASGWIDASLAGTVA